MNAGLDEFIARIPQDKLAEIANGLAADATALQAVEAMAAAGVEATEEQAQALLDYLYESEYIGKEIPDEKLKSVAGGFTTYTSQRPGTVPWTDENGNRIYDEWGNPLWMLPCYECGM